MSTDPPTSPSSSEEEEEEETTTSTTSTSSSSDDEASPPPPPGAAAAGDGPAPPTPALDVAAFRLADGRVISVEADWSTPGLGSLFLHRVRDGACRIFSTTLSPDYNQAHWTHLHLDMGRWKSCD